MLRTPVLPRSLTDRIRHFVPERRRSAQLLTIIAVGMIPLLGAVGLAIDLGNAVLRSRMLQNGVDAGVLGATKRMATGNPGQDYTAADVVAELNRLLGANAPGAVVTNAVLINGGGPDADDCLTNSPSVISTVAGASNTQLWTAHCLQGSATLTFNTFFAQVVGVPTMTVAATATASAVPVFAMSGLMPMAIADDPTNMANGIPREPWGPDWDTVNTEVKTCVEWMLPLVPHVLYPDRALGPNCPPGPNRIGTSNLKGLLNYSGPPGSATAPPAMYTGNSNSTGCHWHDEHSGGPNDRSSLPGPEQQWRGFGNPTFSPNNHLANVIPTWNGNWPTWNNSVYRADPTYNECRSETNSQQEAENWVRFGFAGVLNSGDPLQGQGDFFMMIIGNLGANISGSFNLGPCAGVPEVIIFVPLFDFFADPSNALVVGGSPANPSVHISRFGGFKVPCPAGSPASNIKGTFVQGTATTGQVSGAGGFRRDNQPNVTVIKLVS